MDSFLSISELNKIGFKKIGSNVLISRKSSIYSASDIQIGNNVRIDDFCILSGNIIIGNNIHVAAYSAIYGGNAGVQLSDFSNISSRVCIYAVSDDFSGETMTNPMIPIEYKNVKQASVYIGRHVIVGSGSTIFPGVTLNDGTAIGAMSLVNKTTDSWMIYAGIPIRIIKKRSKRLLELEKKYSSKE